MKDLLIPGLLFLLSVVLGFFLSRGGRPLNTALSALHKLAAIASLVLFAVNTVNGGRVWAEPLPTALAIATLTLFVALVATGAVLSGGKKTNRALLRLHNAATVLAAAAMAGAFLA